MIEHLPLVLLVIFIGSILSTLAGGGLGIILLIVFSFFLDLQTSIVISSLLGFVIQPAKFIHFWRHTNWHIVFWYVLTGAPLSYLGGLYLFAIPERTLEFLIVFLCVAFTITRVTPLRFEVKPTKPILALLGSINGFVAGVVGLGSFLRNPFVLALGLKKEAFLAVTAVISVFLNTGKTIAYVPNIQWDTFLISLLLFSIPVIFLAVSIGKRLMKYISEEQFEYLVLAFVVLGAAKLLLYP